MSGMLKLFLLLNGLFFTAIVISLLVKKKINEKNTMAWLGASLFILALAAFPESLDSAARWIGISYPPSLLFLISMLALMLVVLYQSIQISTLQEKVKELAQHIAVNECQENHEK